MNNNYTQKGGMLLEAIAVLGLIAVSAPSIYKKSVERTEDIRDISKASKLRVLKDAASSYIEKNYEQLVRDKSEDGFATRKLNEDEKNALYAYLPKGFMIDEGVNVYINTKKMTNNMPSSDDDNQDARPLSLISAIVVDAENVTDTRGNKIAKMVGAEGGFSGETEIYGNRGIWTLGKDDVLAEIPANRVVVSSTYSKNMSSSDYVYRGRIEGYPEANMMYTHVDMNGSSIERIGRLAMRYNNGDKWADVKIGGKDEGSTGGAGRDAGLSLLFHGERGEFVGKSRGEAKNKRYEWEDKKDRVDTEADLEEERKNESHLMNTTTIELSVGGPEKNENERDGYLALRSGDNLGCTKIESNYKIKNEGNKDGSFSGGGAFLACTDTIEADKGEGKISASLVADDDNRNAYMMVLNPLNGRKAAMYGEYNTSFYNDYAGNYRGGALEGTNQNEKITTLLASSVDGDAADKNENHKESSVMNLYDKDGKLKTQSRADSEGGYVHIYDAESVVSSTDISPSVSLAGSKNDGEDRSYSVTTLKGNTGYARMQADFNEKDSKNSGAFLIKDKSTDTDVALMANSENESGYFALSSDGNQKVLAESKEGGAVYLANKNSFSDLFDEKNNNPDRNVSVKSFHKKSEGGYLGISSNDKKSGLEIVSNSNSFDNDTGSGMLMKNKDEEVTVKLHAKSKGEMGDKEGGLLSLENKKLKSKAELLTSAKFNEKNSDNGGTLVLYDANRRKVTATTKGPNFGGWISLSDDNKRGVDMYANYNEGGAVLLSAKRKTTSNSNVAKDVSTVEMLAKGEYKGTEFASSVMNVLGEERNSSVSIYGDVSSSDVDLKDTKDSGGIMVRDASGNKDAYMVGDHSDGGGGWLRIADNSSQKVDVFADKSDEGAKMLVGSTVKVHSSSGSIGSLIDANTVQASARIKAGNEIEVKDAMTLIVNAKTYNDAGAHSRIEGRDGTVGAFLLNSIQPHMANLASKNKDFGHFRCIKKLENCPIYDKEGNITGYDGETETWGVNDDVYQGRLHDYALYSWVEHDRHRGRYNLDCEEIDSKTKKCVDNKMHIIKEKWHDNREDEFLDKGQWSWNELLSEYKYGKNASPDAIPKEENLGSKSNN